MALSDRFRNLSPAARRQAELQAMKDEALRADRQRQKRDMQRQRRESQARQQRDGVFGQFKPGTPQHQSAQKSVASEITASQERFEDARLALNRADVKGQVARALDRARTMDRKYDRESGETRMADRLFGVNVEKLLTSDLEDGKLDGRQLQVIDTIEAVSTGPLAGASALDPETLTSPQIAKIVATRRLVGSLHSTEWQELFERDSLAAERFATANGIGQTMTDEEARRIAAEFEAGVVQREFDADARRAHQGVEYDSGRSLERDFSRQNNE